MTTFVAGDEEPKEQAVRKKGSRYFFYFPKALLIERNSLPSTMTMFFCIATTTEGKSRYMCDAGR
jgi:hypothetical protein